MGATLTQLSGERLLLQAYRDAFRQFQREANRLAVIKAQLSHDPAEAEKALLRVERAHLAYNHARDTLAAFLMSAENSRALLAIPEGARRERNRVKDIAELLWELAGKPQGSADDDWYRAERVVRHVGAAAYCSQ
jgi:Protein of unknown function (DUF2934)